jgi:hypothetical protein
MNPVALVHAEASEMFPGEDTLIVSLGTGIVSIAKFDLSLRTIIPDLVAIATDTERTADDFVRRDGGKAMMSDRYFRFNVAGIGGIGLDEAKRVDGITKSTEEYLSLQEMRHRKTVCAEQLAEAI